MLKQYRPSGSFADCSWVFVLFGARQDFPADGRMGQGITSFKNGNPSEGEDDVKNGDKDTA